jgi:WD40 repeat protein
MPLVRSIDLGAYNFSCPVDPSWSPDGTQIALWATLGDCGNQETGGPELAIFDARTGKLTNSITLYSLLSKLGLPTKLIPSPFAWSPDGASVSFSVGYTYYQAPEADAPHGLVTVTLTHNTARYTPVTMGDPATLIWDIQSGKLVRTIDTLAPAVAYAWGADGSLAPATAGATGKGVVSVWQAGRIVPVYAAASNENVQGPPDEYVPQDWLFTSSAPRWSPDGRYLALPANLVVRLPAGVHAFPVSGCGQVCDSTPVAPLDMAFSAALTAAIKGWQVPPPQPVEYYSMDIAWRADGKELATMLPNEDFNLAQPVAKVTIFNTQTGAIVTKLSINRTVVNVNNPGELLSIAWSPRGSSLAALNNADATLTLWRAE